MSIWKEIRTALNSSFGKSNFVPLDELIIGTRHLESSEDILFTPVQIGKANVANIRTMVSKFKSMLSGQIQINAIAYVASSNDWQVGTWEVEKNGDVVYVGELPYDSSESNPASTLINVDINDKISVYFTAKRNISGNYSQKIYISGKITSTPIINI